MFFAVQYICEGSCDEGSSLQLGYGRRGVLKLLLTNAQPMNNQTRVMLRWLQRDGQKGAALFISEFYGCCVSLNNQHGERIEDMGRDRSNCKKKHGKWKRIEYNTIKEIGKLDLSRN